MNVWLNKQINKHTINNPYSLNENCGTGFSLETCSKAGKIGGRSAVDSGQLAEARKKCHNEKQRIGASKAITEWNQRRDPEEHAKNTRYAQRCAVLKRSRPVILEKQGFRLIFPSVMESAKVLSLSASNLFDILNGKRKGPHKGWNIIHLNP